MFLQRNYGAAQNEVKHFIFILYTMEYGL